MLIKVNGNNNLIFNYNFIRKKERKNAWEKKLEYIYIDMHIYIHT